MEFAKTALGSLIRHLIGFVGAFLVAQGFLTPDATDAFVVGLSGAVLAVLWALIDKWFSVKDLDKALSLPSDSTREDL